MTISIDNGVFNTGDLAWYQYAILREIEFLVNFPARRAHNNTNPQPPRNTFDLPNGVDSNHCSAMRVFIFKDTKNELKGTVSITATGPFGHVFKYLDHYPFSAKDKDQINSIDFQCNEPRPNLVTNVEFNQYEIISFTHDGEKSEIESVSYQVIDPAGLVLGEGGFGSGAKFRSWTAQYDDITGFGLLLKKPSAPTLKYNDCNNSKLRIRKDGDSEWKALFQINAITTDNRKYMAGYAPAYYETVVKREVVEHPMRCK